LNDWVHKIASKTKNFTSADLKGLIQNAQLEKMSSVIKQITNDSEETEPDFSISE
jgi:SpoVK/Ycf46/Vps4 family AAA+-type ATPase